MADVDADVVGLAVVVMGVGLGCVGVADAVVEAGVVMSDVVGLVAVTSLGPPHAAVAAIAAPATRAVSVRLMDMLPP